MKEKYEKLVNSKYYKVADVLIFAFMLLASTAVMTVLFYRQSISDGSTYHSDIRPYIEEMLGIQTQYSFPYPILFKTAGILYYFTPTPEWAMVIAITSFNILAMIIVKIILEKQTGAGILSSLCTMSLFFLSMLFSHNLKNLGIVHTYIGVFTPNPWHNATYMAARPFMVLAFFFGVYTLVHYEHDFAKGAAFTRYRKTAYLAFSISLLLATLAKPSYTLVHGFTVVIIMLYRLFKSRFKNLRQTILLGCYYIPTIMSLGYQYLGVFSGGSSHNDEQGIGFGFFRVWSLYTKNIPLAIALAILFPIIVLIFHRNQLSKNNMYRFAWQIYIVAFATTAFLYEKGFRELHFNFCWGYICGIFLVFFVSMILVLKDSRYWIVQKYPPKFTLALTIEWFALIAHTLMGLYYFALLYYGSNFL